MEEARRMTNLSVADTSNAPSPRMPAPHEATQSTYVFSPSDAAFMRISCPSPKIRFGGEPSLSVVFAGTVSGTGGLIATYEQLANQFAVSPAAPTSAIVRSPVAEMVSDIRASLSLRITELATILNVERQTVYAWLRGDATPLDRNQDRLRAVWELARWWRSNSLVAVGNSVRQRGDDSKSVVDLLSESPLPEQSIRTLLSNLASTETAQSDSAKPRPAEFAARRGLAAGSISDQRDRFDAEVGHGASWE